MNLLKDGPYPLATYEDIMKRGGELTLEDRIDACRTAVHNWTVRLLENMPFPDHLGVGMGWHSNADALNAWADALKHWESQRDDLPPPDQT